MAQGLSASDLSQSAAALDALRTGAVCRNGRGSLACKHLQTIYAARLEHLGRFDAPHPMQLAASLEEFLGNLERAETSDALCFEVGTPLEHDFIVFVSADSGAVLGCLKTVSKTAVSPLRWRELWGGDGSEPWTQDPIQG